jgi:hypothetical protein
MNCTECGASTLRTHASCAAFSVSFNVGLGHWEEESKRLAPFLWSTTMRHDTHAGYSHIRSLGQQSFDVRNVCLHSSGLLLFAPSDDEDDSAAVLEHMHLYLLTNLYSSNMGYAFPVTIIRNSKYFSQFEYPFNSETLPLLAFGHPMRHVGHHQFESIFSAYSTMKAAGLPDASRLLVVHSPGLFSEVTTDSKNLSSSEIVLRSMYTSLFGSHPISIGNFLDSFDQFPHAPVCFSRAIIGSIQDARVPDQKQLPHLEFSAEITTSMRAHYRLPPLQHVSTGKLSLNAEAFAREHEKIPGAPFLLLVERSIGDARALRNADEIYSALAQIVNVARVRFEGMELQAQMVVCEAADIFVSVHGSDATNMIFMRPGSVAVTVSCIPYSDTSTGAGGLSFLNRLIALSQITPYCWDNAADFDNIGDVIGASIFTQICGCGYLHARY